MSITIYLPELREMLESNNAEEMREFCTAINAVRVAEFMEGLTPDEIWQIIQHADLDTRAEIFSYLDEELQADIMEVAPREEMAEFISHLPSDDRADVLQSVDPPVVSELMPLIDAEDRRDIQRLQAYPDDTCGAEMTTDFVRLNESMTVHEALDEISRQTEVIETVYYLYVVDAHDHLVGLVSAKQLLMHIKRPHIPVKDLMERDLITVDAFGSREDAAREVARYDFLAIPVVDEEHHMLGIITHDDIMDVMQDEATEDAYRMAGIGPMEESYLEAPFWTVWKSRVFWLACLFVAQLATFNVMAHYKEAVDSLTILALLVPLVISTGGNSGSQAATLITRALALGDVKVGDWFRVFRHELIMGLALGAFLSVIGFLRAFSIQAVYLGEANRFMLSVTICITVAAICICGTLIGSMLPLLFKRMGFDPGMASSPFVATFVDVTGIFVFFNIAKLFLL